MAKNPHLSPVSAFISQVTYSRHLLSAELHHSSSLRLACKHYHHFCAS
jgi:hypothetical protein